MFHRAYVFCTRLAGEKGPYTCWQGQRSHHQSRKGGHHRYDTEKNEMQQQKNH